MDAVLLFAEEGPVFAAWRQTAQGVKGGRFCEWFEAWKAETEGSVPDRNARSAESTAAQLWAPEPRPVYSLARKGAAGVCGDAP